ncbi:MAG TPA: GAF domain-containing sensor histidine kinase [Anaerolineales bacterium]
MAANYHSESDSEQLKQRNRELSILNAIAQALNRSAELDQALHAALAQVAELLGLHTGWVWLLSEASGETYLAAAQNLPPGLVQHPELMEGTCYCLDTYRAGDLAGAANVNVITCSRLKKLVGGTDGLRYHASIPLYAHGRQLGVLNVASADWRELSPEDLRLLYTVGDLLSIAIERARLFARSAEFGAAEERNRLAREIHDTLAQGLAGIALQLETADALLESGDDIDRSRRAVQQALALSRSNLEEARRSVLDLRAAPLEGRSLAAALQALAADTSEKEGLLVTCEITGGTRPLPARLEAGLYRIAQEALSNIVQHAQARHAALRLASRPGLVRLTIADDGQGFDPAEIPAGRFGLVGLNERARLLGGSLQILSSPGAGARIEVTIHV